MIRSWYTALGVNVLLGVPGIIPIWMLYWMVMTVGESPSEEFGDDPSATLVFLGPMVAACAVLWGIANLPLARRSQLIGFCYWLLALTGTLLPAAITMAIWL
ncbi:hypothetical protein [Streptomyces sp. NPDC059009]|uniref:hypothetical protein n=1 Tax=Streptomyces sp. NPDC059009 TaxID=3346694 RepID=UPI0036C05BE8